MISIIGAVISISLVIFIIKNKENEKLGNDLFFISIVSLLTFDIGYFLKINNSIIEYNYLFSTIAFLGLIINYIKKRKFEKKGIILIIAFFMYIFLNLVYPIIFDKQYMSVGFNNSWDMFFVNRQDLELNRSSTMHALGMFARVVMFVVSFYIFAVNLTKEDIKRYAKKLYYISWLMIGFAILEFLISNIFNAWIFRNLTFMLFGYSDSTYLLPRTGFRNMYLPMGLMREPSSYVKALFLFMINNLYLLYKKENTYENNKIIANLLFLILIELFSNSLSGYIYIGALILVCIYMINNKKAKMGLACCFPVVLILFCILAYNRMEIILNVFSNLNLSPSQLEVHSETIRLYSINNNLQLFIQNPLLGCGFGTIYCYSSVVTLMSNLGIVGVVFYVYIMYYINSIATQNKKFSYMTFFIIFITNVLIGHMSQIVYIETMAIQLILLKEIDFIKREKQQ